MREQRSQQWKKNVTTCDHLIGLMEKGMWPKSLTSGSKLNCHACLWIRSLPVSGVRIDLSTDTAAILNLLDLKSIMG